MFLPEIRRVLRLQCSLTMVAMLVAALLMGDRPVEQAISALLGGGVIILSSAVYAKLAFRQRYAPPKVLLRAHFVAEAAKFGLTLLLGVACFAFFKDLSALAWFVGFLSTLPAFWIGLLYKN